MPRSRSWSRFNEAADLSPRIGASAALYAAWAARFNEAADLSPRIASGRSASPTHRGRFNEAADLSPRIESRGECLKTSADFWLQ